MQWLGSSYLSLLRENGGRCCTKMLRLANHNTAAGVSRYQATTFYLERGCVSFSESRGPSCQPMQDVTGCCKIFSIRFVLSDCAFWDGHI